MDSETILKQVKVYLESQPEYSKYELIITPTKYDPRKLQHRVSFLLMEKHGNHLIPSFEVIVNNLLEKNV